MSANQRIQPFLGRRQSGPDLTAFISTWNTANTSTGSSASNQIKLPLIDVGTYDFTVDWGDGTSDNITAWNQSEVTHTYSSSGTYTITITGDITGFQFRNTGDRLKILDIQQWGIVRVGDAAVGAGTFHGCSNMNVSATDIPDFTGMTNLHALFRECSSLTYNSSIDNWDLSGITSLAFIFYQATNFNQSINSWDVSNILDMGGMFRNTIYNQPLNDWDVSNVINFANLNVGMFQEATAFNQNLSAWDVSNTPVFANMFAGATAFNNGGNSGINNWDMGAATNISGMFSAPSFNQPLNLWDTSNVTNMSNVFLNNTSFNQNISSWDVSKVTNMQGMFNVASSFNNGGSSDINNWNTGLVTNMFVMFRNSGFNQPIGNWNVSNVTSMQNMFAGATVFNQNIGGWNVSKVVNFTSTFSGASNFNNGGSDSIKNWVFSTTNKSMGSMFASASAFNQPIGDWDVKDTTNMSAMFQSATAFNQNIGSWNVAKVGNFLNFMAGKTAANYSAANLDAIYNGWSALTFVNTGLNINFNTIKYTAAGQAGRDILTSAPNNWTITDGGI